MQATTWKQRVVDLPDHMDAAILSAMENVAEQGYDEEDDEFWNRVFGEVTA